MKCANTKINCKVASLLRPLEKKSIFVLILSKNFIPKQAITYTKYGLILELNNLASI